MQKIRVTLCAIALGISAVGTLGLHSLLAFASCFIMTHPDKHPIRLPASVIFGTLCLGAFCLLIWQYVKVRKLSPSCKGIALDVALGLVTVPGFYVLFSAAFRVLETWFHTIF